MITKIQDWAIERNLHIADPSRQLLKLGEEYGELCAGFLKNKPDEVIDAIGDMQVVLIILCMQLHLSPEKCLEQAYEVIKNRKGKVVNGSFIKSDDL